MVWWERSICQYCVHANGDESVRQRSGIEVGQYCVHANGDESVRQRSSIEVGFVWRLPSILLKCPI